MNTAIDSLQLKADPSVIEAELNYRRNKPRDKQQPPSGDWFVLLIRAGRGFGKTFSGARWLHSVAQENPGCWMALIGKTPGDVRDDCIDGPGGIMKQQPPEVVEAGGVEYEPSKRRLTWPNGSYATIYSGANHDQIRGFSGSYAWCDEFAAWDYPEQAWDNLMFGMREGEDPRVCITTTPRPLEKIQDIEAEESTVVVTGDTYENEDNLNDEFLKTIKESYEGTTKGRQEIHAEYIDQTGALWSYDIISRGDEPQAKFLTRIVVGVDPAVTSNEDSDETGIIVAGNCTDGNKYVLDDQSLQASPSRWADVAVAAYKKWGADTVVAETNQGGDMVEKMIRQSGGNDIRYNDVRATRGKTIRAEPVVGAYERGEVIHTEKFDELESQMVRYSGEKAGESPDRMDALVWAITELQEGTSGGLTWGS